MGSIMCLGVSVSNSVMLVTFMDEHWKAGACVLDRGGHHRRERAAPADPDDRLRDDHRHGADGPGPGARQPDAGPAGPGGDRRPGDVDLRHPAGRPGDLRPGARPPGSITVALDLPGRPGELRTTTRTSSPTSPTKPRRRARSNDPGRTRRRTPEPDMPNRAEQSRRSSTFLRDILRRIPVEAARYDHALHGRRPARRPDGFERARSIRPPEDPIPLERRCLMEPDRERGPSSPSPHLVAPCCWRASRPRGAAARRNRTTSSVSKPPTVQVVHPEVSPRSSGRSASPASSRRMSGRRSTQDDRVHREVDRRTSATR